LNFQITLASNGSRVYGFAFLDYAALKIWVGSVHDDDTFAALGALLVQVSPKEIIYETSGLSKETHRLIKKYASAGKFIIFHSSFFFKHVSGLSVNI
jgi:DNA mismatch repair protein MSH6